MHQFVKRSAMIACAIAIVGATGGCTRIRNHQGYIIDPTLTNAIQPGVDNRDSVSATLGRPTFAGQFGDQDWYYVSRTTRSLAFTKPNPAQQTVLAIHFDKAGRVASVDKTGLELVKNISPTGDKTPTLGRHRSLFQEIFGNIGAVGASGNTPQGGPNGAQ